MYAILIKNNFTESNYEYCFRRRNIFYEFILIVVADKLYKYQPSVHIFEKCLFYLRKDISLKIFSWTFFKILFVFIY